MHLSSQSACTFAVYNAMPKHIIQAINLTISYPQKDLITGLNWTVDEQEWIEFSGPNGAGKTSLLNAFYGMPMKLSGQLNVLDFSLNPLSKDDLASLRRKIGYARQNLQLIPEKTVRANLVMALHAADRVQDFDFDGQVQWILDALGMSEKIKTPLAMLSQGEQHVVAIARALIHKPKLLLLDQSLDYLDDTSRKTVIQLIQNARESDRLTILSSALKTWSDEITNCKSIKIESGNLILLN